MRLASETRSGLRRQCFGIRLKVEIDRIKIKIKSNEYIFSQHAEHERKNDNLEVCDIETAILNGEILEKYSADKRGESCLILGYSHKKPVHIVCGWNKYQWLVIITVYIPRQPKWINEKQRGRR